MHIVEHTSTHTLTHSRAHALTSTATTNNERIQLKKLIDAPTATTTSNRTKKDRILEMTQTKHSTCLIYQNACLRGG